MSIQCPRNKSACSPTEPPKRFWIAGVSKHAQKVPPLRSRQLAASVTSRFQARPRSVVTSAMLTRHLPRRNPSLDPPPRSVRRLQDRASLARQDSTYTGGALVAFAPGARIDSRNDRDLAGQGYQGLTDR